jgi:hypothetical protein
VQGSILGIVTVLAAGVPSAVAAYFGYRNGRALRTGNEKTVGEMVTEVHGKDSVQRTEFETHR